MSDYNDLIQAGEEVSIHGSLYKVGRHSLVYVNIDGDWKRSGKTYSEFEKAFKAMMARIKAPVEVAA